MKKALVVAAVIAIVQLSAGAVLGQKAKAVAQAYKTNFAAAAAAAR